MKSLFLTMTFIKILILLILIVMLYLIMCFLYSGRYWPDVHNYFNANITIKHIPTISELNITIYEVGNDETTTENYESTTDFFDYKDATIDDYDNVTKVKYKRSIFIENNDYAEVPKSILVDYFFDYVTKTVVTMNDVVDVNKLSTVRSDDVEIFKKLGDNGEILEINQANTLQNTAIYPWNAAIFIKNTSNSQFEYFCDAALLSSTVILTAARCVNNSGNLVSTQDLLVVLGKQSLANVAMSEQMTRITKINVHENFTVGNEIATNDLAMLTTESDVVYNDRINSILVPSADDFVEEGNGVTSGWAVSEFNGGEFSVISLKRDQNDSCLGEAEKEKEQLFCANYNDDLKVCPSFGASFAVPRRQLIPVTSTDSILATRQYQLQGIRHGDPTQRGICYDGPVLFTSLKPHLDWIHGFLHY